MSSFLDAPILSQGTNQARPEPNATGRVGADGGTGDFKGLTLSNSGPVFLGSRGISFGPTPPAYQGSAPRHAEGLFLRRAGICHDANGVRHERDDASKNAGFEPVKVAIVVGQPYLVRHVAAYLPGRVHRAVPSDQNHETTVRQPMAA